MTSSYATCTGSDPTVTEKQRAKHEYIYRKINKQIYYIIFNKDSTFQAHYQERRAQEFSVSMVWSGPVLVQSQPVNTNYG